MNQWNQSTNVQLYTNLVGCVNAVLVFGFVFRAEVFRWVDNEHFSVGQDGAAWNFAIVFSTLFLVVFDQCHCDGRAITVDCWSSKRRTEWQTGDCKQTIGWRWMLTWSHLGIYTEQPGSSYQEWNTHPIVRVLDEWRRQLKTTLACEQITLLIDSLLLHWTCFPLAQWSSQTGTPIRRWTLVDIHWLVRSQWMQRSWTAEAVENDIEKCPRLWLITAQSVLANRFHWFFRAGPFKIIRMIRRYRALLEVAFESNRNVNPLFEPFNGFNWINWTKWLAILATANHYWHFCWTDSINTLFLTFTIEQTWASWSTREHTRNPGKGILNHLSELLDFNWVERGSIFVKASIDLFSLKCSIDASRKLDTTSMFAHQQCTESSTWSWTIVSFKWPCYACK